MLEAVVAVALRAAQGAGGVLDERRRRRRRAELRSLLVDKFAASVEARLRSGELARTFDDVAEGRVDPYSAAETILTAWYR